LPIDQYALQQLAKFNQEIMLSYEKFDFTAVFHKFADFCSVYLSSFYLDIIKDRLYVEKADGRSRKSAQTACWHILDTITRLMAPILSFTAEQISDHYQKNKKESIHLQTFSSLTAIWELLCEKYGTKRFPLLPPHVLNYCKTHEVVELLKYINEEERKWEVLKDIRSAILKAIEVQREKQIMKHSLEANVTVYFDLEDVSSEASAKEDERLSVLHDFYKMLDIAKQDVDDFFKEFLIVSQFKIATNEEGLERSGMDGLFVKVEKAKGEKCPRCWQWDSSDHEHGLCSRCQAILS